MQKTTTQVTLKNGSARLVLYPQRGRFDLLFEGGGGFKGLTCGVTLAAAPERTITLPQCKLMALSRVEEEVKAIYRCDGTELDVTISPAPRPGAFEVTAAYTNVSAADAPVKALLAVCSDASTRAELGLPESRLRVYRNGWFAGDISRVVGLTEPHEENSEDDAFWGDGAVTVTGLVRSSGMTQIQAKGFYVTAGFLSEVRQFGLLSTAARGANEGPAFSAASLADGKPIVSNRRYCSEPLYVSLSIDRAQGFADYASLLAERMEARRYPEEPSVWCSWYYYFDAVRESDILENVDWLSLNRAKVPLRVVQVDDGWQADVGDWLASNGKFPRGMRVVADEIRRADLIPGLWFAPFIVSGTSGIFRDHPDWVVRNDDGSPKRIIRNWHKDVFALDLTNPHVLGHVADVTGKICYDWGFDYIKIDFLPLACARGHRLDDTKTRAQVVRRGLEVIRQNAKPDTYILGCGAPFGPSVGIVDGQRVSMDVAPNWAGELSVLTSSWALTRWWMHNLLWHNDPDCILLRDTNTSLTAAEVTTLANMVILSGGLTCVSDKMADLPADRVAMLSRLFPVSTTAAVPVDLYDRPRPSIYFAAGERVLLGVFNWEDRRQTFRLNPRRLLGDIAADRWRDFWNGSDEPIPPGAIDLTLEPHESRLFSLLPTPRVSSKPG